MIHQMHIDKPQIIQLFSQIGIIRIKPIIGRHIVEHAIRRKANAHPFLADGRNAGLSHFHHKARAVLDDTAIRVGALVGIGPNELFDQIAIGTVDFHTITPSGHGILGRLCEFLHGAGNFRRRHGMRHGMRLHAFCIGVNFTCSGNGGRCHQLGTLGQIQFMADAATMHQLHKNLATNAMHGIAHRLPA